MPPPLLILLLLLPTLYVVAYLLRRRKLLSGLALMAGTILLVLLIAEFSYRWFFKYKAPTNIMECGDKCYQHDSLLGFRPALPGSFKVIEIAPKGDTFVNVRYTLMADTM